MINMLKNRDRVIVLFFFTSKCDERLERILGNKMQIASV